MPDTSANLLEAQRAVIETAQLIGLKALDTTVKLMDLNIRTLREMRASVEDHGKGGNGSLASGELSALAGYLQQAAALWVNSGSEVAELLRRQGEGVQAAMVEMVTAGWRLPSGVPGARA